MPVTLTLDRKKFALFGAVIFTPSCIDNDMGHYTAVVKLNNLWEAFDDIRAKSHSFSGSSNVVIHNLFYIEVEK